LFEMAARSSGQIKVLISDRARGELLPASGPVKDRNDQPMDVSGTAARLGTSHITFLICGQARPGRQITNFWPQITRQHEADRLVRPRFMENM
jgi:hypothetical protein